MDGFGLHAFLAVTALVLGFVASLLARDLRTGALRRRLDAFAARTARNDARLWCGVFGQAGYLQCDGVDPQDPVSKASREAARGCLQSALDAGILSFGPKARRVTVLSCEPDEGAGDAWNLRRFPLRDAAGHRFALRARFPLNDRDGVPPRLWEGEGTELEVRLEGIEPPTAEEAALWTRLSRAEGRDLPVPWCQGISR